jgi:hypothetical protein
MQASAVYLCQGVAPCQVPGPPRRSMACLTHTCQCQKDTLACPARLAPVISLRLSSHSYPATALSSHGSIQPRLYPATVLSSHGAIQPRLSSHGQRPGSPSDLVPPPPWTQPSHDGPRSLSSLRMEQASDAARQLVPVQPWVESGYPSPRLRLAPSRAAGPS